MPWPKEHAGRTRERIVRSAAAAFRKRGVAAVRLDDVMAGAGLTHGGFYAHFRSKEHLLEQALAQAGRETVEMLSTSLGTSDADPTLRSVADAYLSPLHAAHPERGCPVAALGSETARNGAGARRQLAKGIERRIDWMRRLPPGAKGAHRGASASAEQVIGALACMVGGVILARALEGRRSIEVLEQCRSFLHRALQPRPRQRGRRVEAMPSRSGADRTR
jgi:TetR/AcrR family transcriptional repressor of nem operon